MARYPCAAFWLMSMLEEWVSSLLGLGGPGAWQSEEFYSHFFFQSLKMWVGVLVLFRIGSSLYLSVFFAIMVSFQKSENDLKTT